MVHLPFKDAAFDEIHCIHVLEHLTRDLHTPALLEMCRVLHPDGACYVEVPDFHRVIERLHAALDAKNARQIHIWRTSVFGKTERPGMAHHFGFDAPYLTALLNDAGFSYITEEVKMISDHHKQEPVLLMKATRNAR
jgi:predicted SAM-dependent methyltransferase